MWVHNELYNTHIYHDYADDDDDYADNDDEDGF